MVLHVRIPTDLIGFNNYDEDDVLKRHRRTKLYKQFNHVWKKYNWKEYGCKDYIVQMIGPEYGHVALVYDTYKYVQPYMLYINMLAEKPNKDDYYDGMINFIKKLYYHTFNLENENEAEYFVSIGRFYSILNWILTTSHFNFIMNHRGFPSGFIKCLQSIYEEAFNFIEDVNNLCNITNYDYYDKYYYYDYDYEHQYPNVDNNIRNFPLPSYFNHLGQYDEMRLKCYYNYINTLERFIQTWDYYYNYASRIQRWYKKHKERRFVFNRIVAFNELNKKSNLNLDMIQNILLKVR